LPVLRLQSEGSMNHEKACPGIFSQAGKASREALSESLVLSHNICLVQAQQCRPQCSNSVLLGALPNQSHVKSNFQ
jgi:hypothetical protein